MWPSWGLHHFRGFEIDSNVWICSSPHGPELTLWALFTIRLQFFFGSKYAYVVSPHLVYSNLLVSAAALNTYSILPPGVFVLLSVKLLSPGPIICFDCQGSELALGGVAMLQGKNRPPVVMWARGLLGWRAKTLRWDQFMEEDYV